MRFSRSTTVWNRLRLYSLSVSLSRRADRARSRRRHRSRRALTARCWASFSPCSMGRSFKVKVPRCKETTGEDLGRIAAESIRKLPGLRMVVGLSGRLSWGEPSTVLTAALPQGWFEGLGSRVQCWSHLLKLLRLFFSKQLRLLQLFCKDRSTLSDQGLKMSVISHYLYVRSEQSGMSTLVLRHGLDWSTLFRQDQLPLARAASVCSTYGNSTD